MLCVLIVVGGCTRSSRDVMFDVDRVRTAAKAALDRGEVGIARTHAQALAHLLTSSVLKQVRPEPDYARMLADAQSHVHRLAEAKTVAGARAAFTDLDKSCQRCHDGYQFKK